METTTPGPTTEPIPAPPVITEGYEDVDPYTADHRDYLLIQTRVNLMAVSQMSDLKANLMLTLSAVMLQFALMKVSDPTNAGAMAPYWVITLGALTTISFSAWSTVPKTPLFFREQPDDGSMQTPSNILHFSNFIQLSLPAYKRHMKQVMRSPPHTHEAILEEIHAHGRYIARRKYLPLRLAYISFLLTWIIGASLYVSQL
jgi:hypothetical protein